MKVVAAGLLLFSAALAQSLMGAALPLVGSRPDLPLVVVLAWAMLTGSAGGAAVGFAGGMLLDSASGTPFGLNAALLGTIGYITGLGETNLYRGNLPFFLATGAVATLVYHVAMFLVLQATGSALPPLERAVLFAVPAALLNALLLAPAFMLCRRLLRSLSGWRQLSV